MTANQIAAAWEKYRWAGTVGGVPMLGSPWTPCQPMTPAEITEWQFLLDARRRAERRVFGAAADSHGGQVIPLPQDFVSGPRPTR